MVLLGFGLSLGTDLWQPYDISGQIATAALGSTSDTWNVSTTDMCAALPLWTFENGSIPNITGCSLIKWQTTALTVDNINGCYRSPLWP